MDRFTHNKQPVRDPIGEGSVNKPAPGGERLEDQNVHDTRSGLPQVGRHRMRVH